MKRLNIDVLYITEMRWPKIGYSCSREYHMIHLRAAENKPGYGTVCVHFYETVKGYVHLNERIHLMKADTKPQKTAVINTQEIYTCQQ